ncbi:hypothetical protein [Planomonospora parontospora]|uniref:hypothetical protein n=1 Tax=Planomonospora parontospora TaxID=58119 RepID=UPI0019C4E671|nr:hypothetical protein [Planomonospora parontospora]GGL04002.1 hypothetical protein GCM10014719_02690 [Planomonospora parontospora subsp. antibiotica]GII13428.1 hypothetical protein Ppa05_01540 [Planomonospora parontospora subsp. antibiotica]
MEYVSRVPRPPLDGLIDDLYYLEGAPPYARLTLLEQELMRRLCETVGLGLVRHTSSASGDVPLDGSGGLKVSQTSSTTPGRTGRSGSRSPAATSST